MSWQVSKLVVDFNSNLVTVGLETIDPPTQTILLNFTAPSMSLKKKKGASRATQSLDNPTRKALTAQAKQILIDAANSL